MSSVGGRVIDTARAYGRSEEVIGELLASIGNRNEYFLATKTPISGAQAGERAPSSRPTQCSPRDQRDRQSDQEHVHEDAGDGDVQRSTAATGLDSGKR